MITIEELLTEIGRLRTELSICHEAIEVAYNTVNQWAEALDDGGEAQRRTTLRRLNEAVGKALPRLLYENPEGQRMYGLRYRELFDENKRLRKALGLK